MTEQTDFVINKQAEEIKRLKKKIISINKKGVEQYRKGFFMGFERAKCNPQSRNAACEYLHVVQIYELKKGKE